jgi:hypothetical protein
MPRLCSESSRPYPGRSVQRGGHHYYGSRTEGHLERGGIATEPYGDEGGAPGGNAWCEWAEVSRGHSSPMPGVMPVTR